MAPTPVSDRRRAFGLLTLGLLSGALLMGLGARQALAEERQQLGDLVLVQMSQQDQMARAHRFHSTHLAARTLELLEAGDVDAATRELVVHVKTLEASERHRTPIDVTSIIERAQARMKQRVERR